jgi:DNA primase
VRRSRVLTLVEGPTDALRFLAAKIPTVAILGASSWTDETANLIAAHRAEHVLVVMDADDSGRKVAEEIVADCQDFASIVKVNLPDKTDPGNVNYSVVKRIRKRVRELTR